mmetsp:Transcript_17245/g.19841  ORF Transcript_17245/g.19841 Transcript_17245/m.19841 type:complete len:459 (-) Transcript_17245:254-1630(-)
MSTSLSNEPMEIAIATNTSATTTTKTKKKRRRNLGRQARKRRKKALEIEAVAIALVTAAVSTVNENKHTNEKTTIRTNELYLDDDNNRSTNNCNVTRILPSDRSYVLDDIKKRIQLSERDRIDLIRQLGYLPGNALSVVTRVKDAFSAEDIQQVFATAVVTKSMDESAITTTSNNTDISNSFRSSRIVNNYNRKQSINNETTTAMVQAMMDEPLVVELYPLVLRDESSSTKRRRKRRRDQKVEQQYTDTTVDEDTTSKTKQKQPSLTTSLSLLEPFPTIYWVTHPLIKVLISKLELDRFGYQFEQRLVEGGKGENKLVEQHDDGSDIHDNTHNKVQPIESYRSKMPLSPLDSMKFAHKSYGYKRRKMLSKKDMDYVKYRKWDESAFAENCGVAGIRNSKAVKCLHAHAAHYWSGNNENIVGRWVWEQLKSGRCLFRGSKVNDKDDKGNNKNKNSELSD